MAATMERRSGPARAATRAGLVAAGAACAVLALAGPALAAAGGDGKGGLPQLDPSTYVSQLFWLVVCFGALYLILWKVGLPRLTETLENREKRILGDIERASKLKADADALSQAYEKGLADAKAQAQAILRETQAAIAKEAEERQRVANEANAKRVAEAEARIAKARDAALVNVKAVAADVVQAAAQRVAGVEVSPGLAAEMVELVMRERR